MVAQTGPRTSEVGTLPSALGIIHRLHQVEPLRCRACECHSVGVVTP